MAVVEIQRVGRSYTSGGREVTAIGEVSFDIEEQEFVCLLGPSGCGKTTVLNMVAGFDHPSTGRILVDGTEVTRASREKGVVFQSNTALFGWRTARANVEFGLRMRGVGRAEAARQADRYLALVGLTEHAHKRPHHLSGGMQQRVQIARVLANEPRVLLMDEPFGALDAITRTSMQAELEQIWRTSRSTVLFVTHDVLESVRLATRIIVMSRGPEAGIAADIRLDDLPRPRREDDPAVLRVVHEVTGHLHPGERIAS